MTRFLTERESRDGRPTNPGTEKVAGEAFAKIDVFPEKENLNTARIISPANHLVKRPHSNFGDGGAQSEGPKLDQKVPDSQKTANYRPDPEPPQHRYRWLKKVITVLRWLPLSVAMTGTSAVAVFQDIAHLVNNWRFWVFLLLLHPVVSVLELIPRILRSLTSLFRRVSQWAETLGAISTTVDGVYGEA